MRRMRLVGAWFLVLTLTTALTWQIVSAADDQVSDRPVAPLNVSAPVLQTSSTPKPSTTVADPISSTTTVPVSTPSTSPQITPSTSASGTSTPTTAPSAWQTRVIKTAGGTVVVSYRPGEVVLETATPKAGFKAEVEKGGPPKVEIKFESEETKVEIRAEWNDGDLDVEVAQSEED